MAATKIPSQQWTRNQRGLAWLLFATFFIGFVLFFFGYAGRSWYVAPDINYRYPPDNPVDPLNFGLFYLCFRGHCKYDLRQDYQIVKLLPPELGITWSYQNYRTTCMAIVTVGAIFAMLALGAYLLFLSGLVVSLICGYVTAGFEIFSAIMTLIGVIIFGKQFYGYAGVSPFGWSFALAIVGALIFLINGALLILHTINVMRYIGSTRYQAAGRPRTQSTGVMGCLRDCTRGF